MARYNPETEPKWSTLDKATFTGDAKKALKAYQDLNEETKLQREVLEEILAKKLANRCPSGMHPRISFKWGNVSWIPVEEAKKTVSRGKNLESL